MNPEQPQILESKNYKEIPITPEQIENAKDALLEFVKLKPEEDVLLIKDFQTKKETFEILQKAVEKIGSRADEFVVSEETNLENIEEIIGDFRVILNMFIISTEAADKLYDADFLAKNKSRMVCLMDLSADVFKN